MSPVPLLKASWSGRRFQSDAPAGHRLVLVPYRKDGVRRRYLSDFIVELANGGRLVVEIKGQMGDAEVKSASAHRWCNGVNNDGRFGR